PRSTLFPYTTLFRSGGRSGDRALWARPDHDLCRVRRAREGFDSRPRSHGKVLHLHDAESLRARGSILRGPDRIGPGGRVRRSLSRLVGRGPSEDASGKESGMFVGKRMTRNVITVSKGDTLKFASDVLHATESISCRSLNAGS